MFFITTISFGQTKLLPPEIEINDTVLNVFITQLKTAVNSKDKDFIISVLSPDILNSFLGVMAVLKSLKLTGTGQQTIPHSGAS